MIKKIISKFERNIFIIIHKKKKKHMNNIKIAERFA